MNKILPILITSVVFLSACSKSNKTDITPKITISATIDGVNEDFSSLDSVRKIDTIGVYFEGTNATTNDRLRVYTVSSGHFGPGTYYSPQPGHSGGGTEIMFFPGGSEANGYYTYYTLPYESDPGFQYFGSITVSALNGNQLQGTFNGSLIAFTSVIPGTSNPRKIKIITDGKFNLILP